MSQPLYFLWALLLLLLLSVSGASAELRRRSSIDDHRQHIDGADFYLVQFRSGIGYQLLQRLQAVLGYRPQHYVPDNTLVLWIDSQERGEALLRATPHIRWLRPLPHDARYIDFANAIASLRTTHQRYEPQAINRSNVAAFDSASLRGVSTHESFDRDTSDALTVRLRVSVHNMSASALRDVAQPACRTHLGQIFAQQQSADNNRGGADEYEIDNVHCDDAARVAEQLAAQRSVMFVDMRAPLHTFNRWSVPRLHRADGGDQRSADYAPLHGLTGGEHLLSISDTGVASDTCFFRDAAGAQVPLTSVQRVPTDTGHRKLRAYWSGTGGDFGDAGRFGGHGTHVAGTALGAGSGVSREHSGAAPDARLVFVDLLAADDPNGFLAVPLDIGDSLFRFSLECGALVHSASWGGDANGRYTFDEASVDRFAWEHRHFLPLFAAGNSGPRSPSIASPAMAKNALSIGAAMNGADAVRLAQTTPRPDDDYEPDWLASFSSRGSRQLPFRKPELVAPGGAYVWSASSVGPAGGQCGPLAQTIVGLQGTSMATPLVAGAAVLLRQYFADGVYPNAANVPDTEQMDLGTPTASLLRALLTSSALPLRGVYPRQPFRSAAERIDASGYGRVSLDRVLEHERVQLAVLSNEQLESEVTRQASQTWCLSVHGAVYDSLVVTLAYADYPSSPLGAASLVNDLSLRVTTADGRRYAVNEQVEPEQRSTIERVVIGDQQPQLQITVDVDALGFGDSQSYSLVAVLVRSVDAASGQPVAATLSVGGPHRNGQCQQCASKADEFIERGECSECGNGIVEDGEECDTESCCDPGSCRWLTDRSPCSLIAGDCRLVGECHGADGCMADPDALYGTVDDNGCQRIEDDDNGGGGQGSPPPVCTARPSSHWSAELAAGGAAVELAGSLELCCAPLRSAFEHIEFEHLFAQLARQYAAARLNVNVPGARTSATVLLEIFATEQLLAEHCGVGFLRMDARHRAAMLLQELQAFNEQCEAGDDNNEEQANQCLELSLDRRLCAGGGVYDRVADECLCHSNRHPAEPDCAHLACSGNGASMYDYESGREQCVCLENWAGVDCSQCAKRVNNRADLVYHCVGVPLALYDNDDTMPLQRHYLLPVLASSVAARLTNAYYPANVPKEPDGVPGRNELDCWCRAPDERIDWRQLGSAHDTLMNALDQQQFMRDVQARAQPLLEAQTTVGRRTSNAAAAQLDATTTLIAYAVLALWLLA
jgi:hypothetical protein